ncbi:MAG: efflux RND transporter periplasmic adaptor subunit, partial [Myxococcota bacterium]|nr:efflux RND transporter periplasmic adaptor subunit [Myxococcota bacterium]
AAAGEAEARARVRLLSKRLTESLVKAPFAGRIAERYVDPGATVTAGVRLVRIVQVAPLRVRFEVPEHEIADLTVGRTVRVVTSATAKDPSAGVAAKITGIAGEVSRSRRVATLEALIEQPPPGWLPGMYAEAIVDRRTLDAAIVVPAVAVISRLSGSTVGTGVFVADAGVARWVPVKVAARADDRVAVEGALEPGAPVLVAGHVELSDGSKIALPEATPAVTP